MDHHGVLYDGEPKSSAADFFAAAFVYAEKALENSLPVFCRNADSGIFNRQLRFVFGWKYANPSF